MKSKIKDEIKKLIKQLEKESKALGRKSKRTWQLLRDERLPQEDAVIHSVYETQAAAHALKRCVIDLEKILKKHGDKDE